MGGDHRRHRLRRRRVRDPGAVQLDMGGLRRYAVLGGIGSGMVYSSCINIVAKWYPEKKGWRTGFVNGGWAYGAVPFIFAIGAASSGGGADHDEPKHPQALHLVQAIIMTVGIVRGRVLPEGPAEELVAEGDRPAQLEEARHPRPAAQPARAAALQPGPDVADPAGQVDRHPVRLLHRLLPVRRRVLLRLRPGRRARDGRGGGRLRRLLPRGRGYSGRSTGTSPSTSAEEGR